MRTRSPFWLWRAVWAAGLVAGLTLIVIYAWLPADGGTGALESFTPEGYRVQWLLEDRPAGLQENDLIVSAGGYTAQEWLDGAPRGLEWRDGGTVLYEIERQDERLQLPIRLAPVPIRAIIGRWFAQFVVALAFLTVGTFVFWQRPRELPARLLMVFCTIMALQYLGDAYNFQFATLPWRWPFWYQLAFEHATYSLGVATVCYFALVFPAPHPWVQRFPRLVPLALYVSFPVAIVAGMALSSGWNQALLVGNHASWLVAIVQFGIAIAAGFRSIRTARDPVTRAQIKWIVWCACVGMVILIPGYVLPLIFTGQALLPHPVTMLVIAFVPFTIAIAILRLRLFDIEIVINRTLVYGTLTILLAGLYLVLVRLLTWVVERFTTQGDNAVAVFVATLTIALAFEPLRRRIQAFIDRTFYRTKLDHRKLLSEISDRLGTSLVLEQLNLLLAGELPRRLQVDGAVLSVLDWEGGQYVPAGEEAILPALPVGHPLIAWLQDHPGPLVRLLPPSDLPARARSLLDEHGLELAFPLVVGDNLVGLYGLGRRLSDDAYSREQIDLLQTLSRQAAIAVENGRLFQATGRQAEELAGLHEAAVAISSSLAVNQVLLTLAEYLGQVLDVGSVLICDLDEATYGTTVLAEWVNPECDWRVSTQGAIHELRQYPSMLDRLLGKEPLILQVSDLLPGPAIPAGSERRGWHSVLIAPLVIRDRVIGYAELWETRPDRRFSEADVRLCRTLSTDAAAAIEHARLYEQAQQEIAERKVAEARIQASLAEKELLLQEIHHRVKNNLQVISSLLYLQSRQVQDETTLAMFEDSRHRVRSMALVHERLYRSQDLARVDFAEYVRSLASYLHRTYNVSSDLVKLNLDVDDLVLGIDLAVPCGLILNELVSNSLKYAFPENRRGRIDVEFHREQDGRYALTVRDDGVGLPQQLDTWDNGSLGLHLVRTLVDQLNGSLEVEGQAGTQFRVVFSDTKLGGGQP